jgi:hypothetical protein
MYSNSARWSPAPAGSRSSVGPGRIDELLAKVALDGMSKNRRAIVQAF